MYLGEATSVVDAAVVGISDGDVLDELHPDGVARDAAATLNAALTADGRVQRGRDLTRRPVVLQRGSVRHTRQKHGN